MTQQNANALRTETLQTPNVLHVEAIKRVKTYQKSETALIDILKIEEVKAFVVLGYPSLHTYCVGGLGLSDSHAYALIGVARKSKTIPEIKDRKSVV